MKKILVILLVILLTNEVDVSLSGVCTCTLIKSKADCTAY